MNLKDLVKVKSEKKEEGVRVQWDESGDVGFILAYCGKNILTKSRKDSLKKNFNHKTHQVDEVLDEEKFDFEVMNFTLQGWWGLKVKHLKEILDPTADLSALAGQEEVEIPYSADNKELIIRNYNLTFSRFVSSVSMDIEMYRKYKEEAEIKNS